MAKIDFCEYSTGLSPVFYNLLVSFETTGEWTQFYVDDVVFVDWGSGHYLEYKKGIVYGRQVSPYSNKPIIIRSPEEYKVKTLRFGSGANWDNTILEVNIHRALDLVNASKLCYRLESMHTFTFFGNNEIRSFESAWEDCTNLLQFNGMDTTRAITFKRAWKNANKLKEFPNIYAKECLTVEEAWMGCTSMEEFPTIDVSNCRNFASAWRGNVNLIYFPYVDTGSGENFDHTWAYCTSIDYFPSLDFTSAQNMNYTFAYLKCINTMPFIDSNKATTFISTFEKMYSLNCIAGIDTNGISSRDYTKDIFKDTPSLLHPDDNDQSRIRDGWRYVNENPCYYNAGRSTFFVHCETTSKEVGFRVTGGDFEVDWGDGLFIPYNEGYVQDIPIGTGAINIRSEENITQIEFIKDTKLNTCDPMSVPSGVYELCDEFITVEIKRGKTLEHIDSLCEGMTKLEYFEILGFVNTTNFDKICKNCTSLKEVGRIDLHNALSVREAFKNCTSLTAVDNMEPVDAERVVDFFEMFYNCISIEHLQKVISTNGQDFTRMFSNMTSCTCIDGVDTRNQVSTFNMFNGSDALVRPTRNERDRIEQGALYDNLGNCGGVSQIHFIGTGSKVSFQTDSKIWVDWGDGNVIEYLTGSIVSGTPVGTVYVMGEYITEIDWMDDSITDMWFDVLPYLGSMKSMFNGFQNLKTFTYTGSNRVVHMEEAFANSGIVNFNMEEFEYATDYTGTFDNTTSLDTVNNMNTQAGIYFENMFRNSSIRCIGEINTCLAQFPDSYIRCEPDKLDCGSTLDCDDSIDVCILLECNDILDIWGDSTIFENTANLVSPDQQQQEMIKSRYHYIGVNPC